MCFKTLPASCGIRSPISGPTKAPDLTLSWAIRILFTSAHLIAVKSILTLTSYLRLHSPKCMFSSGLSTDILYVGLFLITTCEFPTLFISSSFSSNTCWRGQTMNLFPFIQEPDKGLPRPRSKKVCFVFQFDPEDGSRTFLQSVDIRYTYTITRYPKPEDHNLNNHNRLIIKFHYIR
jgi:hypothetical protein